MLCHYEILGVPKFSQIKEIKRAYRRLAFLYHPDKNDKDKSAKFREATEAYEFLSDDEKKEEYDLSLKGESAFSILKDALKGQKRKTKKGLDLKISLQVNTEDIVLQKKKGFIFNRNGKCPNCSGTGSLTTKRIDCPACSSGGTLSFIFSVTKTTCSSCDGIGTIPEITCPSCKGSGIKEEKIRKEIQLTPLITESVVIHENGHYPKGGGIPGNLFVNIQVERHPVYTLRKLDVRRMLEISPAQAVLGDIVACHFFGRTINVMIPAGSHDGDSIDLEGEGLSYENKKGFFSARIKIKIPHNISEKEKSLYNEILTIEKEKFYGN